MNEDREPGQRQAEEPETQETQETQPEEGQGEGGGASIRTTETERVNQETVGDQGSGQPQTEQETHERSERVEIRK